MRSRQQRVVALLVLVLGLGACSPPAWVHPEQPAAVAAPSDGDAPPLAEAPPKHRGPSRPNIVLVTTDDQTLDELAHMPLTRRIMARTGTTFTQALSPHPLCCPARAELLTGQYAHNNGVQHNHGRYGGFKRLDTKAHLGTWLQAAGYRTAFVGKFLNEYQHPDAARVPGWDIWDAMLTKVYGYYGTTFFRSGDDAGRYSVDAVATRSERYVERLADGRKPFFLWASQVAPHNAVIDGASVAPLVPRRDADVLEHARPPSLRSPSFNDTGEAVDGFVGRTGSWTAEQIQALFTRRVQSLQSVDRSVASLFRTLEELGELRRTYVFFTSDNGYLLGEHGVVGKNVLHEQSVRVPLLVAGPRVRAQRSELPVTLVDLAPTFLEIAGAERPLDGVSVLPTLRGRDQRWRDTQLVQTGADVPVDQEGDRTGGWSYRGVRTERYTFGFSPATGRRVLFDRAIDPHQQIDFAEEPIYQEVVAELQRRTDLLVSCAGASCARRFGPLPEPAVR